MKTLAQMLFCIAVLVILCHAAPGAHTRKISGHAVVYISNADSREIYVLELNENDGRAEVVQKVPVTGTVMPLAISPDHRYLYASLRSEPYSVSSFAINPSDGKLTPLQTALLPDNMAYLSTDRSGRYLLSASYSGNKISVNALDDKGEVDPSPIEVVPTGKNAHCIATDLSNRFLFVSNLGDDVILQYRFDQTNGSVQPNTPPSVETKKGAGPRHFIFSPNHRFVFGINELDGTANTYRLNTSGTLTLIGSNSVMPAGFNGKPWTADIHMTPNDRFLYVSERRSSTIAAFQVNEYNGKLTPIGNYPSEAQPRGFNIDPEGKYLLAAGQTSNSVTGYAIDQNTGALRKLWQMDVGKNPNWIEIIALAENNNGAGHHK